MSFPALSILPCALCAFVLMLSAPDVTQARTALKDAEPLTRVLVVFHTDKGGTLKMAQAIAKGIESVPRAQAVLRRVPGSSEVATSIPVVKVEEISQYDGIALGSPVHFAGSTPQMRSFIDSTLDLWSRRALEGLPATVFMSAGSGAGREAAVQSLWGALASHGMIIVTTGIMGNAEVDKRIPQGVNPFGAVALTGMPGASRPSPGELHVAELQGQALARAARAMQQFGNRSPVDQASSSGSAPGAKVSPIDQRIAALGLDLKLPAPAGSYLPFKRVGNLVFINQVALRDGKVLHPGTVGARVSEPQAREATRLAMINVLAALQQAAEGDLSRIKQVVQLTGFFQTDAHFTRHADLMNEASALAIDVFGDEVGRHTRGTVGAISLPLDSAVEIQAVFEMHPEEFG
jgi:NAD(P)H dehydrogenase (quinone)